MKGKAETWKKIWDKYKFVGLVALAGIVLLVWPTMGKRQGSGGSDGTARSTDQVQTMSLEDTEAKMEEILSQIDGVGELRLMLTMETGGERQLARDTELSYSGESAAPEDYRRKEETVVVSGDGGDEPVVTSSASPTYRGALVVCQGAGSAEVKLAVTQAVAALTGLSSDRISVVKCQ